MDNIFSRKFDVVKYLYTENELRALQYFGKKKGVSDNTRETKVIVSLTSYPRRFNLALLAIESIMRQSLKPDKIILWIAKDESKGNKDFFKKLEVLIRRGLTVCYVNDNIKSYKKLIYALQEYPEDIIVTCDDDTIYPRVFLENLYSTYLSNKESICAYRCAYIEKSGKNRIKPYIDWRSAKKNDESANIFPTGVGGVLYPPYSLSSDMIDTELFMSLAPTADDVWFKAMALKANSKTIIINDEFTDFPTIRSSQKDALWKINVEMNQNDVQIKKVFDYYDLYYMLK